MTTNESWAELHDATLESMELRWSSGELFLRLRTGDTNHLRRVIVVSALRQLACDRQMPWGSSVSINEVRGPAATDDGASVLEIEMQSGDLIRVVAGAFSVRDAQ